MKFKLNSRFIIDTEQSPWKTEGLRIGLWGGSGSGKSSTAALLGEQFLNQGGVLVVFEPRAEYHTLKEKFDVVVCGGPYAKDIDFVPSSPAAYANAVVEHGASIIFYTSDVEDETKLIEFISRFLSYLLKYNEVTKRPIMLITEETEEYAPLSTKGRVSPPWVFSRMIRQFRTASRDARKLNIVTVNLSPRPQEIAFTIRQLCNLTFYGKFSPQDATYVDRECLKPMRAKGVTAYYKDLLRLDTGEFLTTHDTNARIIYVEEKRLTKHGAVTPKLEYTAPRTEQTKKAVTSLTETIQKALEKERLEESELDKEKAKGKKLEEETASLKKELENLQTALTVAGKIKFEQPTSTITPTQIATIESEVAERLKKEVIAIFERYKPSETVYPSTDTKQIYETWAPKLPHAAKRILKLLAIDKKGLHMTNREIAVALGYRTTSGTFKGAISTLKRNHLIKSDGTTLWVE